jgi:hypothetical protein
LVSGIGLAGFLGVFVIFWTLRVRIGTPRSSGGSGGGSILERVHQFNVRAARALEFFDALFGQLVAIAFGIALIWAAWCGPDQFGWQLPGWLQVPRFGLIAFAVFGIWECVAIIIAMLRSPPAPPPTKPGTW